MNKEIKLKTFTVKEEEYRRRLMELESKVDMPEGFSIEDYTRRASKGLVHSDSDSEDEDEEGKTWMHYIAMKTQDIEQKELLLNPILKLTKAFISDLLKLYEEDITNKEKPRQFVFFIDSYENLVDTLEPWLLNLLDNRYGNLPCTITFVIGGNNKLDINIWSRFEMVIDRMELEPLKEVKARQYIKDEGIDKYELQSRIINFTNGVPKWIAAIVEGINSSPAIEIDISDNEMIRLMVNKYFKSGQNKKKAHAIKAATARKLDKDLIITLLGEKNDDFRNWIETNDDFIDPRQNKLNYPERIRRILTAYQREDNRKKWNKDHKLLYHYFDEKISERISNLRMEAWDDNDERNEYKYKDQWGNDLLKIKKLLDKLCDCNKILESFRKKDQKSENTKNSLLDKFFVDFGKLNKGEDKDIIKEYKDGFFEIVDSTGVIEETTISYRTMHQDKDWQSYTLEYYYHGLCYQPQEELNKVLRNFLNMIMSDTGYAWRLAKTVKMSGEDADCEGVRIWGEKLFKGIDAYLKRNKSGFHFGEDLFNYLSDHHELLEQSEQPDYRTIAMLWKGECYRISGRTLKAIKIYIGLTRNLLSTPRAQETSRAAYSLLNNRIKTGKPNYASLCAGFGRTYLWDKNLTQAKHWLELAKAYDQLNLWYLLGWAEYCRDFAKQKKNGNKEDIKESNEKFKEAIETVKEIHKNYPGNHYASHILGTIYQFRKDYELAIIEFSFLIDTDKEELPSLSKR